jgi:hypothetical protein
VDLTGVSEDLRRRFDARVQARERLPRPDEIRSCANAIERSIAASSSSRTG